MALARQPKNLRVIPVKGTINLKRIVCGKLGLIPHIRHNGILDLRLKGIGTDLHAPLKYLQNITIIRAAFVRQGRIRQRSASRRIAFQPCVKINCIIWQIANSVNPANMRSGSQGN